jgi:glucans biosynthesis protein
LKEDLDLKSAMLRHVLIGLAFVVACAAAAQEAERPTERFDRAILEARAAELARGEPALPPRLESPERLTYSQYRSIRFQRGASIWAREGRTFTVDLYYPGFIYDTPVNINLVVGKTARRVLFTNEVFEHGPEVPAIEAREGLGYSGFRVRGPINEPNALDEFLVFQGASYFRAVGRGQVYGLSARGLAVRTARPEGEEFPLFTDFWIERPPEGAEQIVIHALLQSPSVVGAYTFTAVPGEETLIDVDVALFPRVELVAVGLAPLTSMFLFDATNRPRFDDYRDAVHDSDGLQILNGQGERIWRPIANPRALQVSSFVDENPQGFGLVQRKRHFSDYEDADALYDRRPTLWVEPKGAWGAGHVELVEIPSDREINDNIVAYWQPRTPLPPGEPTRYAYRLRFTHEPLDGALARVVSTRIGRAIGTETQRAFIVDFRPEGPIPEGLEVSVSASTGEVLMPRGVAVPQSGVYRVSFELEPGRAALAELRAEVRANGKPWGETWLYRWTR